MTATPASPKQRKSALVKRNEALRLELENSVLERRVASIKSLAGRYDAVEANKNRRQPRIETKSEDQTLDPRKRLLAHNIGRDLERNFAPARAIMHQFRVNVVGELGKLQVNTPDGEQAADWFNQVWARDCDYRDDTHWSTLLQNIVAACIREGDILAVFDDNLTAEDTGKLIIFEADQIAPLADGEFKKLPGYVNGWTQDNGIVRDQMGRILGYIASGKRGLTVIEKLDDATFYPREVARLVKNPWRVNQGRGVSALLTASNNFQDLYEILAKELQSAKVAASLAGFITRTDAVTDFDNPGSGAAYLPENNGKAAVTTWLEGANSTDPTQPNYERFESLTGGMFEYMADGDKAEFPKIDRPNIHLAEFMEAVLGHAGASVGLARAYTILRADSSYTSFRGDMVLSWATFYMMQKWLERSLADWAGRKALAWSVRKNLVSLQGGWESRLSWKWPRMPSVDESKEADAVAKQLKNGTTDFGELIGPDWRNHFDALAEQLEYGREKQLPLSVYETASGGVSPVEQTENNENE